MGFIYIIKNIINDKVYIGQTMYTPEYRFQQHLKSSNYIQTQLYNAMNKYGKENFYVQSIEKVDTSNLNEKEIYWINYYNSYEKGYNMTIGGEGCRKINIEDIYEDWNNGLSQKEIKDKYQVCDTTIWKIFNTLNITELERKQRKQEYSRKNNNEIVLSLWNKNYSIRQISEQIGGCRTTIKKQLLESGITEEEIFQRGQLKKGKPIIQYDLNNNFIEEFSNAKQAAEKLGLKNYSQISNCCNNKRKSAYGYIWKFK